MTPPPTLLPDNEVSFLLSNDRTDVALYLPQADGELEDFLHLLLSAVASYSSPILRGAVGVTVILIDIPQLNPLHLFPLAVKEFLRSLHLPTVLKFLIQRGFVKISVGEDERVLLPGLDPSQLVYQSADFSCRYLDSFFSNRSLASNRMVTLHFADNPEGQTWSHLLEEAGSSLDNETASSSSSRLFNRTKAVELIDFFGNWTAAEEQLAGLLTGLFESTANVLPKSRKADGAGTEQKEDEIFCKAWRGMMMSVREEKSQRKKKQAAALKASGQKLREGRGATGKPSAEEPVERETSSAKGEEEGRLHSEL
jgi:hypothetical protein